MTNSQSRRQFQNRLLTLMDQKNHWAWQQFVGSSISKAQLKIHFQQEYDVYVRDFPVLLAQIYGRNPPLSVRKMLAENIFEEDTGQLSLGVSHPDLFLKMMRGLGFREKDFEQITLLASTRRYRNWLDKMAGHSDWVVGAAVMTIFVEGSVHDREEINHSARSKTPRQISAKINMHPLVKFHNLLPQDLDLIRAHQMVEGGHRHDAYAMVVDHAHTHGQKQLVLTTLQRTLELWLRYRDGVAKACRLKPV